MRHAARSFGHPIWRQGQDLHVSYTQPERVEEKVHAQTHQRGMGPSAHEALWV